MSGSHKQSVNQRQHSQRKCQKSRSFSNNKDALPLVNWGHLRSFHKSAQIMPILSQTCHLIYFNKYGGACTSTTRVTHCLATCGTETCTICSPILANKVLPC